METRNMKSKKIFISYRFSGEDIKTLKTIMDNITRILKVKGYNFFCSLYKEDYFKEYNLSRKQRYDCYKQNVKDSDIILFFIKSDDKSGGMVFELNQAIKHRKKIILAIQKKLNFPNFRDNAHDIIEYNNLNQLYESLNKYSFKK